MLYQKLMENDITVLLNNYGNKNNKSMIIYRK